jgi:hypothetical protein
MMRLDVEGLANTFKLSEGAPEQLDGELIVIEELRLGFYFAGFLLVFS